MFSRAAVALLVWTILFTPSFAAFLFGGYGTVASATCNFSTAGPDCAPGVANILLNGGANDGKDITVTVSITSGQAILTVGTATFAATDCQSGAGCTGPANKAIGIWGAGTGGAILSTTITGFTSSTVITLGANASTTVTATSKEIRYGTDNTTAIQSVMTAMGSSGKTGHIYFPDGMYMVNGTPQAYPGGLTGSAILLMPDRDVTLGPININFDGQFEAPYGGVSVIGSQVMPSDGSIIMTTRNDGGGVAAIVGGASGGSYSWTLANIGVKNLLFRTYDKPQIIAVDGRYIAGMEVEDVWFDTGTPTQNITLPTDVNAIALATPLNDNGAFTSVRNVNIVSYYVGVQINEHAVIDNVADYFSRSAYFVNGANHAMSIGRIGAYHNVDSVQFAGGAACSASINIAQLDVEFVTSGTFAHAYDFDDATNAGCGYQYWHLVQAGVGPTHNLLVNGGANLVTAETGALASTIPVLLTPPLLTANLPTCNSGTKSFQRIVTDALSPTYGGNLAGSGSVTKLVVCNGANWQT